MAQQIHADREKKVAEIALKVEELTSELKAYVKPFKLALKREKKLISKILEDPYSPMDESCYDDIVKIVEGR